MAFLSQNGHCARFVLYIAWVSAIGVFDEVDVALLWAWVPFVSAVPTVGQPVEGGDVQSLSVKNTDLSFLYVVAIDAEPFVCFFARGEDVGHP